MNQASEKDSRTLLVREGAKGLGVVAILIFLMLWLSGAFIDKVESGPPLARSKPVQMNTKKVERREFPILIDQVGTIQAKNRAQIASRVMAQVQELYVGEGDDVIGRESGQKAPTVMARLDDRDIQAKLRQVQSQIAAIDRSLESARAKVGAARAQIEVARANRDKAVSDYKRYEDLYKRQAATGQQLEYARAQKDSSEAQWLAATRDADAAQGEIARTQAQREQAEAALAEARVLLSYTVIETPFTGRVIGKTVNVGDMVSPGQAMFVVETSSHPELHAFVSESFLLHLHSGEKMGVFVDALNRTFTGDVREIVPSSDPATRTMLVKVSLPADPDLVNGLFGRLQIPNGTYDALVVPWNAVREIGQLQLVDVVDPEGYPQRRFVTLGQYHEDLVEVLSGVREGEEVVIP